MSPPLLAEVIMMTPYLPIPTPLTTTFTLVGRYLGMIRDIQDLVLVLACPVLSCPGLNLWPFLLPLLSRM